MKKIVCLFLACISAVFAFSGCSTTATKNVEVAIVNQIDDTTISGTLSLPDAADSGEYFRQLANKNDLVLKGVDEGYIHTVADITNSDTYAWMFYINGAISEVGVDDYIPADGDKLELIYLDWTTLTY